MNTMKRSRELSDTAPGLTRREFVRKAGTGMTGLALGRTLALGQESPSSQVALARDSDRATALQTAVDLLGRIHFAGRDIYLKGNFNSPDPFPASTHPETLGLVVDLLRKSRCGEIVLVERSGMGSTREIWQALGVTQLAAQLEIRLLALDDLSDEEWRLEELPGMNWKQGIEVPRFLNRDALVVQLCNLKTHRFGGIFSASLKNTVGLAAKYGRIHAGYNYMAELHASEEQGAMIAEMNLVYAPALIIMDAMQVFVGGGPETGDLASPEVILAAADRVAIDAAGVALLRLHGTPPDSPLTWRAVFEQDQLKRAAELNLGVGSVQAIQFLTAEASSSRLASQIESILEEPPEKN